jgi:prepilin-type N-terminal cleavage/methylation domain-containing protein
MQKNKAFTLIELLVVIAIIAILAAILFPVFAQAKVAAKGAASLSNVKQSGLSEIMYQNDFDDAFVITTAWNDGGDPISFGTGVGCSPWTWLVQPYMKTGGLMNDPVGPSQWTSTNPNIQDIYTPMYGYNYTALSPWAGIGTTKTVTSSQPHDPSDLVMFATRAHTSEWNGFTSGTATAFTFTPWSDDGPMLNVTVEAPNCYTIPSACLDNWGDPDLDGGPLSAIQTIVAGRNTGEVSRRKSNGMGMVFTDGHAKYLMPGDAATGTNWSDTLNPQNLIVTNTTTYRWYVNTTDGG